MQMRKFDFIGDLSRVSIAGTQAKTLRKKSSTSSLCVFAVKIQNVKGV
jgi:hypothetical protein